MSSKLLVACLVLPLACDRVCGKFVGAVGVSGAGDIGGAGAGGAVEQGGAGAGEQGGAGAGEGGSVDAGVGAAGMVATGGGGASAGAPALGGSNSASAGTETGGSGGIPVCLAPAAMDNTGTSPIIDFDTSSDYGSMTALGTVTGTIRADTDGNNAYVLSGSGNPGDQSDFRFDFSPCVNASGFLGVRFSLAGPGNALEVAFETPMNADVSAGPWVTTVGPMTPDSPVCVAFDEAGGGDGSNLRAIAFRFPTDAARVSASIDNLAFYRDPASCP